MRFLLSLLVTGAAACGAPAPHLVAPPAVSSAPAPALTAATLVARSHAVLELFDRGDADGMAAILADDFVHFEGGAPTLRDAELTRLRARPPGTPMFASRTWTDEFTQVGVDHALFIGKATEVQGGNDSHGGYCYVGWYTLGWVRQDGGWRLRLWTWQRGGGSARDTWNEIYRNDVGFEKQPNRLLVDVVKSVTPGTALDLAMGQGRNALFLAQAGWKVTGVDFADEGLQVARDEAARRKLDLTTVNADIDAWDFGVARWDLVAMIYPGGNHLRWIEKAKQGLRPGGLFVLEYFAAEPADPDDGYRPGQLAALFAVGFDVVRDDLVEDRPDWAKDHARLVRFVARKHRR